MLHDEAAWATHTEHGLDRAGSGLGHVGRPRLDE